MKSVLFLLLSFTFCVTLSYAQVGIGTTSPKAFFNVIRGQTVLFGEDTNYINNSAKLIWYGSKGALRAGYISNENWNTVNVGQYSFATGYNTMANGYSSMAIGQYNTANGYASLCMGTFSSASGNFAVAMGSNLSADGYCAMATGQSSTASGYTSRALGYVATANADFSTAMGNYISTNTKKGSFIIGDQPPSNVNYVSDIYKSDVDNQMMMRFAGGYKLYSSTPQSQTAAVGVELASNGNAWQTLSDSTRKENFRLVNGASFLQKIARMRLGSWNYKGQDVKQYRHYGPMAQEFFTAFGRDELGIIGEDKSINQADFDGVNLIAIQALIKENQDLKAKLAIFEEREKSIQARLDKIESLLADPSTASSLRLKP